MKKFMKHLVLNKAVAGCLIRVILRLHSECYKWAGRFATVLNDGIHPKHRILRYKQWFLENIDQGWTVLDVGSDTGLLAGLLAKKAGFVYGIEIDLDCVAIAKSQCAGDNIEYVCADATTYDYSHCPQVDCVILSNVLEHIEGRIELLKKLVCQVKWARENQKRFLIRVPMIDREWIVLYKKELGLDSRLDGSHYVEYTLEQFRDELTQAKIGIKQVDIRFGEIYAVCEAV